jgi:hypothetical protein
MLLLPGRACLLQPCSLRHRLRRRASSVCAAAMADVQQVSVVLDMVANARACNSSPEERASFVPLSVTGLRLGFLRPELATTLASRFNDTFQLQGGELQLSSSLTTLEARSEAVARCTAALHSEGHFPGWRSELLPVAPEFGAEPLLLLERAAVPAFGVKAYGVHVNCFVRQPDGEMRVWVARRSRLKQTWPGMLDHMVAGGQVRVCAPVGFVLPRADNLPACAFYPCSLTAFHRTTMWSRRLVRRRASRTTWHGGQSPRVW